MEQHKCRVSICIETSSSNECYWTQEQINRFTFEPKKTINTFITKWLKMKNLLEDWKKYCVTQGKTCEKHVSWSYDDHYDYDVYVVPQMHKDKPGKINNHLPVDTSCYDWQKKLNKILRENDVIYVTFKWTPDTVISEVDKTALENKKHVPVEDAYVEDV